LKEMEIITVRRVFIVGEPTRTVLEGGDGEWIAVDIFGEIGKLVFISYANGFVATLEKGTNAFVASIKITDVFGDY